MTRAGCLPCSRPGGGRGGATVGPARSGRRNHGRRERSQAQFCPNCRAGREVAAEAVLASAQRSFLQQGSPRRSDRRDEELGGFRVSASDPQGTRDAVLAMPEHLRDALRIETATLRLMDPAVFVAQGRSAIMGTAAALGWLSTIPTVRGHEPPSWRRRVGGARSSHQEMSRTLAATVAEVLPHRLATTGGELPSSAAVTTPRRRPGCRHSPAPPSLHVRVAAELAVLKGGAPHRHRDRRCRRASGQRTRLAARARRWPTAGWGGSGDLARVLRPRSATAGRPR
jgi:hypothetical protein